MTKLNVNTLNSTPKFQMLVANMDEAELITVQSLSQTVFLKKDEYLFHEGIPAKYLYFIKTGKISIIKDGLELASLNAGQFIGEIALIDQKERSSSAKAIQNSELILLSLDKLREHPNLYAKITLNLSLLLASRLRETNHAVVLNMQNKLQIERTQKETGYVMSYILVTISCYVIGLRLFLDYFNVHARLLNYASIQISIVLALVVLLIVSKSQRPLSDYGLNIKNWKSAISESFLFTLPLLLLIGLIKWISLKHQLPLPSVQVSWEENVAAIFNNDAAHGGITSISSLIIGYLLFSPVSEFIARGCLQTTLRRFLFGRHSTWVAILIASLLYAGGYTFLSPATPVVMSLLGCFWGWLYSRHSNIIGISLSHMLIGIWINMLGFGLQLI